MFKVRTWFLLIVTLTISSVVALAQEGGIPGGCSDGIDNDGDGLIDCLDSDCASQTTDCPAFNFVSSCSPSGGTKANIIDVQTAFRDRNGAAVTFTIPVGATKALVYTSSIDSFANNSSTIYGNEDFIITSSVLNLGEQTSSGFLTYAQSTKTDGSGTSLFGWQGVAFGNKVSTGALAGHDASSPLNDLTFSVSGTTLTITEDNSNIKTSYLVEFTSPTNNSLLSNGIENLALDANEFAASVEIPSGTDFIIISSKGTGVTNHNNLSGGTEESFSNMRMVIDLSTATVDGYVTVVNGGTAPYHSTYAFEDHDFNSSTDSLWDAPTIAGDYNSKNRVLTGATGVANLMIYQDGGAPNQLHIVRDDKYGNDFDDVYIFEFFKKTGLPMASEFIASEFSFYEKGTGSGGKDTFDIPAGSNFAVFQLGGLAENANNEHNENSVNAYAIINLNSEMATGWYFQQVGHNGVGSTARRDHNFAFKNVPLDNSSTRTHANTIGTTNAGNNYDISFELTPDKTQLVSTNIFGLVANSYTAVMLVDFFGSKSDITFDNAGVTISESGNCPTVSVSLELCNPGSGNTPTGMPISFYDGDPTNDANAILLDILTFDIDVAVGQCATRIIEVDLSELTNKNIDLSIVVNDDGSLANGIGNAIGSTFVLTDLENQANNLTECNYTNNLITETINVNNCPDAVLDNANTDQDTPITIDVQDNDSDPDNDLITTSILTNATNGNAVLSGNDIIYTPNPDYVGSDTIVYQIDDGNGGIDSDTIFINVEAPLPVELVYFSGTSEQCKVQLSWKSEVEKNFLAYSIERSFDQINFRSIGQLEGLGGLQAYTYQFTDETALDQQYYRLKMIDNDGSFEYSEVLAVNQDCFASQPILIYPNPVTDGQTLSIKFYSNLPEIRIDIVNQLGQVMQSQQLSTVIGYNAFAFDIDDLPPGVYYLKNNNTKKQTQLASFVKVTD